VISATDGIQRNTVGQCGTDTINDFRGLMAKGASRLVERKLRPQLTADRSDGVPPASPQP